MKNERDMQTRRRARARWPIVRKELTDDPGDDLSETTTPGQRIAMMWPLAVEAWRVARKKIPDYARSHVPGRLFRPGERPPDDDD